MSSNGVAHNLPASVGVLGGGRMGAGIAHAFLVSGSRVSVVERDADAASGARERVVAAVEASVRRRAVDEPAERILHRLSISHEMAQFRDCGLVVEAVPEDFDLKAAALAEVEQHLRPEAYLATNTSSISVSRLASTLARPERALGLHFFNPVPASSLVEVVVAGFTSPDAVRAARQWVEALGKTAVVVNDAPGFASSRLGVAIALEAMRMVEERVASPEDIDNAMVLGYRHPIGPLRTTDLVGLDVRLDIAEYLHETLGERFAPPQILREKVAEGALGRKAGRGFYMWE